MWQSCDHASDQYISTNPVAYSGVEVNGGRSGGQVIVHHIGILAEESLFLENGKKTCLTASLWLAMQSADEHNESTSTWAMAADAVVRIFPQKQQ